MDILSRESPLRPYLVIAVVCFVAGFVGFWAVTRYQESQRAYFVSWEAGQQSNLTNERNCRPPRVYLREHLCRKKV